MTKLVEIPPISPFIQSNVTYNGFNRSQRGTKRSFNQADLKDGDNEFIKPSKKSRLNP